MHLIGSLLQLGRPHLAGHSPLGLRCKLGLKVGQLLGQLGGLSARFVALILALFRQCQRLGRLCLQLLPHALKGFPVGC
jgi:hypothetical protein